MDRVQRYKAILTKEVYKKSLEESKERINEHEETFQALFAELEKVKAKIEAGKKKAAELEKKIAELEMQKAEVGSNIRAEINAAYLEGAEVAGVQYEEQVDGMGDTVWEMGWKATLEKAGVPVDHPAFKNPNKFPRSDPEPNSVPSTSEAPLIVTEAVVAGPDPPAFDVIQAEGDAAGAPAT